MNIDIAPQFFYYVAIMASLVLGFTGFKVAQCKPFREDGEVFELKKLLLGFARHLIAISGLSIVYVVCSLFGADLAVITINGTEVTIPDALNIVMLAAIAFYGAKLIKNASAYLSMGEKFENVQAKEVIPQTTFNTDPTVMDNSITPIDEVVG